MLQFKQAQTVATEPISTFAQAAKGMELVFFAGKADKRQVVRLVNKATGEVADIVLSSVLTREFQNGEIKPEQLGSCEIHERTADNGEKWYILQRPANTSSIVIDGTKLSENVLEYSTSATSRGLSAEVIANLTAFAV